MRHICLIHYYTKECEHEEYVCLSINGWTAWWDYHLFLPVEVQIFCSLFSYHTRSLHIFEPEGNRGNNIRPHPVCFYFPESWENCHERANYHYSAYRKADSSFANRKMCAETFFLIILQKNDNQPYKKKIKTIVRWFQIHIFVTESKITEGDFYKLNPWL